VLGLLLFFLFFRGTESALTTSGAGTVSFVNGRVRTGGILNTSQWMLGLFPFIKDKVRTGYASRWIFFFSRESPQWLHRHLASFGTSYT